MYLHDMLIGIDRISQYIEGSNYRQFKQDYKTVDAVIRNFEIIGEAAKNLPDEIKTKYPEVPWAEMYLLRNKISHTNTLELIMRLFGMLQLIICRKIRSK